MVAVSRTLLTRACALVLVGLLVASCSRAGSSPAQAGADQPSSTVNASERSSLPPDGQPVSGGTLRFAVPAETTGWNTGIDNLADAGHAIASTVFEPLAIQDRDGNVEPYLAESIQPVTPGSYDAWTIRLRPNVRFHNGEALDADALKQNLDFYRGDSALTGLALKPMYESVTIKDPLAVDVKLTRPWAAYPSSLAVGGPAYVMAPAMLTYDAAGHFNGDRLHPIGTGPFQFQEWRKGERFSVVRNDHYWVPGQPYLDRIDFLVMTDPASRIAALESKQVDVVLTASTTGIDRISRDFNVVKDYDSEETYIQINTIGDDSRAVNPFKNAHARKALALATDRKDIVAKLGGGLQSYSSPFAPSNGRWGIADDQTNYPAFDLSMAKSEVEAYKRETGASQLSFSLIGIETVEDRAVMQDLQTRWKAAGIEAELQTMEQTTYVTQVVLGGYQAALFRNYGYRDPDSDYSFFHSSTARGLGVLSVNFSQYHAPALDQALDAARASDDFTVRKAAYESLVKQRNEAGLDVWLFGTPYAIVTNKAVHGLRPFEQRGFANIDPKPWVAGLWKAQS